MRNALPGYYRPSAEDVAAWLREGTVALDANVLLDAYRYSPAARTELLRVLGLVKARLFLPHQAALEFHRNRIGALADHIDWFAAQIKALETAGQQSTDALRNVVNQCQATKSQALQDAAAALAGAFQAAVDAVRHIAGEYDLDVRTALTDDHVLRELDTLLEHAVGSALPAAEHDAAVKEAKARAERKIPPGWKDAHKNDPEVAAGDYLLWVQLLAHARLGHRPVVLVTRDLKEDWTRRERGMRAGTHPHLVEEMLQLAGVPFTTMTTTELMREAARVLDAEVSVGAFAEISEFDRRALRRLDDPVGDGDDWDTWLRRNHPELLLQLGPGSTVTQGQMRELLGPLFDEAATYRSVGSTWPKKVREVFLRRAAIAEERSELESVLRSAGREPGFAQHLEAGGYAARIQARIEELDLEAAVLLAETEALPRHSWGTTKTTDMDEPVAPEADTENS
jgi:Arc/MetJ-type ribon-helix-helix transcriptional regulator